MLNTVLIAILVVSSLALIGLVLIQQGKGADAGASFGGGGNASQSVFGSAGSGNFLTRATSLIAVVFFACCLVLAYLARHENVGEQVFDFSEPTQESAADSDIPITEDFDANTESASDIPVIDSDVPTGVASSENAEVITEEAVDAAVESGGTIPLAEDDAEDTIEAPSE